MSRVAILLGGGATGGAPVPVLAPGPFTIVSAAGSYAADSGVLTVTVTVTPPSPMGTTVGGHIYLEVPDTSVTGSGPGSFVAGSSQLGGGHDLRGAWKTFDAGAYPYVAAQQPWTVAFPVQTRTLKAGGTPTNVRIYVNAYSAADEPVLVRAGTAGATPSIVITVDPNVAKPGSGSANAPNVTGVTATVLTNDNSTGKLRTPIAVTIATLPNPVPAGWGYEVCLTWFNAFPDYTDPNVGQVASGIFNTAGLVPSGPDGVAVPHTLLLDTPASIQQGVVWIRALLKDSAGNIRRNSLVPGVTPGAIITLGTTTGTTDPTQLSNVDLNLGLDHTSGKWGILTVPMDKAINASSEFHIDPATGKWSMASVDLLKAVNTSAEFHIDPVSGKWSMNTVDLTKAINASSEFHIDAGTGKWSMANVDMSKASNLSAQFALVGQTQTLTNIAADLMVTGRLQVGGGKISLAKFFDNSSNLIGFIGDDTTTSSNPGGTGYNGAWFKRVGIGGAAPTTPAFFADSSGNVVAATLYVGDASGAYGSIGASSWFKRVGIGGTLSVPNFYADSSGNVIATSVLIADASGSAGFINSTGSWVKRLGVGGTSGAPGFYSDSAGNCVAATLYVGNASGAYGFIGAASWLKQVAIGGSSQYDSSNQIVADVNGTLRIPGGLVVGSVANATNAGTAAVFLGTVLMSQLGSGTLPVGVVYAGQINCSQLNGGTINASITMNSPTLNISGGAFTINLDSSNGFRCSGNNTIATITCGAGFGGLAAGLQVASTLNSLKAYIQADGAYLFNQSGTNVAAFNVDASSKGHLWVSDYVQADTGFWVGFSQVVNSSGQFCGAGVYTPLYGLAAAGFNPIISGTQYYGGTQTIVIGGVTLTFKGGAFISAV